MLNEALLEDDHRLWVLKCVADSHLKIRLSTYGKYYGETVINRETQHEAPPDKEHTLYYLITSNTVIKKDYITVS